MSGVSELDFWIWLFKRADLRRFFRILSFRILSFRTSSIQILDFYVRIRIEI